VAAAHELGPASTVDEKVVERDPAGVARLDRLDERQLPAEAAPAAPGDLQMAAERDLAARVEDPDAVLAVRAARLQPRREQDVHPEIGRASCRDRAYHGRDAREVG